MKEFIDRERVTDLFRICAMALTVVAALFGCSATGPKAPPSSKEAGQALERHENDSDLTFSEAQSRKSRLDHLHYQIAVNLPGKDETTFLGKSQIQFELTNNDSPLRLDFYEGTVQSVILNGQELAKEAKKRYWIELPAHGLKVGENDIKIEYTQEYSHQGEGLHKFVDPETHEIFLYTQFETFDANRFMPCFDQPDLKASFTLSVDAPANWQVISTVRETEVQKLDTQGTRKLWKFPATPLISTYLFSLHAGPYQVWNDQFEDIPLRLFARSSLASYVHPDQWFLFTKQGLKFYNSYFDFKYPFKKYDQVIVPEFNAGAMENVAAVTFSERFVRRAKETRSDRRHLAGVLLHEMAHMWFGDIVTMKWWNDLWLNESFATFMSSLAMHEGTEFKESWQEFNARSKSSAYWEDELITSHPIEADIHSVKVAFANFDGITYGKGASALKQLWAYMSPEKFQKGLQSYINTYAFKNADLKEFIGALQKQTAQDLNLWAERWLRQSGPDRLIAKWKCEGDTLQTVELTSESKNGAAFRPQTVQLALFDSQMDNPVKVIRTELTQSPFAVTVDSDCPKFVFPNYQDDGYAEVTLDPVSLSFAKQNLRQIHDPLLRTMVWHVLWQMVRDTKMSLKEYVAIVNTQFPGENDEILNERIVTTISGNDHASVLRYWPQNDDQEIKKRTAFIASMERQYLRRFKSSKSGSDVQKFWFDSFVALAQTPSSQRLLVTWQKNGKAGTLPLDSDRQWAVLGQLARFQNKAVGSMLADLKKADSSERGELSALAVESVQPRLDVKQKWMKVITQSSPSLSFAKFRTVTGALFPSEQAAMAQRFGDDFYAYLKANGAAEEQIFPATVARNLTPLNCNENEAARLRGFLEDAKSFTPTVLKTLKINLQEDERCQHIRAVSEL